MAEGGERMNDKGGDTMKLTFKCTNGSCCQGNDNEHCINLQIESVMDEKNMAVLFCPKCGRQMKQVK